MPWMPRAGHHCAPGETTFVTTRRMFFNSVRRYLVSCHMVQCSVSALAVVSHDIVDRRWGERDEGLARYGAGY